MSNQSLTLHQQIVNEIDAFLARTGMTPTRFGVESVGDRSFVTRVRAGRQLRTDTIEAMRTYMRAHDSRPPRRAAGNVRVAA